MNVPTTDAMLGAAAVLALVLLLIRLARIRVPARPDVRSLVASGVGSKGISQRARVAEDVVGLAIYREGQRADRERQNVPAAAATSAPTAAKRQERRSEPSRYLSVTV